MLKPQTENPRSLYTIGPFGSARNGIALFKGREVVASHPSPIYLGALLEAMVKGADKREAHLIAKTIYEWGMPTYEERMQHFQTTGPWKPAIDPFDRSAGS